MAAVAVTVAGRGRKQNKSENTKRVRRVTGEERNKTNKEVRRMEKKNNSDSFWGKLKKEEREREKMGRTDGCSGESRRFYCAGGLHVS